MVDEFAITFHSDPLLLGALVLVLAFVHLAPPHVLKSINITPPVLLSVAGGVSIIYVFLHLFPLLDKHRSALDGVVAFGVSLSEFHIYVVVFIGIALYYGLERLAIVTADTERTIPRNDWIFWTHIGGFAIYNVLIGYALMHGELGAQNSILFTIAMAFHLFGNDAALEQHHQRQYDRIGRWVLMASVILGAVGGVIIQLHEVWFTLLLGLLTGGIVFNAIKEELPGSGEGRFWAFFVGSIGYAVILLVATPPV